VTWVKFPRDDAGHKRSNQNSASPCSDWRA
jgi:hypothetical protein